MALSGRKLRISRGGTAVVGARTDNFTINNEPIDITDKDDAGWRTLIADAGLRSISADVEGVLKDGTLIAAASGTASALIASSVLEVDGVATFTGDFMLTSVALGAEQGDAITFTANMESSGTLSVTLAPYNTALPAVTGTVADTETLTTTNGTWAGDATITYAVQWQEGPTANANDPGWADLAGETASTLVLATANVGNYIRAEITATNSEGSTVAYSNIVGPVAA